MALEFISLMNIFLLEALYLARASAACSDPPTSMALIRSPTLTDSPSLKSLPYYLSASEDGDVNAMVFAGSIYQYTSQEATRFEQALKWYGKALDDNAKVSEDKKLTENNVKYCYDNIKKMVDEGQVTQEAAAKWLQ